MTEKLTQIGRRPRHDDELTRRRFLELVGASAALASACTPDRPEQILPYTETPRDVTPGVSTYYATSLLIDGFATGLVATTREGRPLKIEGNPAHPASLGATSLWHQASVLELYDPDRGRAVTTRGLPASWDALDALFAGPVAKAPERLRLLLEPTSSSLVHAVIAEVKQRFPAAKVTFYAPTRGQAPGSAAQALFGAPLAPQWDFARADVVVALDADFLATPYDLRPARDFATRRRVRASDGAMNRLYVVEPGVTITGTLADERLRRPARRVAPLSAALLRVVAPEAYAGNDALERLASTLDAEEQRFVAALGADLARRPRGTTLVVAGERQPKDVHVLAYALNLSLGNLGATLGFSEQALDEAAGDQDLAALASELHAGQVSALLVFGGNPAYDAPADLDFAGALRAVDTSVFAGLYANETARATTFYAPLAHPFESWGDGRAYDGTWTIAQPLIRSLHGARSVSELLAAVAGRPEPGDHARLRVGFGRARGESTRLDVSAAERLASADPAVESAWARLLARGFDDTSALAHQSVQEVPGAVARALDALASETRDVGLELDFFRSPTLHDGRYANVSWLPELPAPVVKLCWDNAAFMSPATAARLGIPGVARDEPHPVVELSHAGRSVRAPVVVLESHADDAVSVWLGYGRAGDERLAAGVGFDAYRLRTSETASFGAGVGVRLTDERYPLAFSQLEFDMHDRELALATTVEQYRLHPDFTAEHKRPLASILPEYRSTGPAWAMSIDLTICTGCSVCELACQAENNVLVVGKDQVRRGRSMHWLRVDSYRLGSAESGRVIHQPMMCQHCQDAPCEYVCPVNATVHSPDGLNEMVYNRCIGTRFCSNNCPYKVRRFNWFDWKAREPANQGPIELQRNPEVTVRDRGVMEKCTYCVQRIRAAEIRARIERRSIRPGEVTTACAQACPTQALRFDSLEQRGTAMVEWRAEPRSYFALHETGARPRTMYLARIDNPNPELS
jgi:molybdopterin-containing oxidoreductase family iron-sulfur binding subunit